MASSSSSSSGHTYAITGANRGLGLEFVRQLSANPANTIIAAVRSLGGDLAELRSLATNTSTSSSSSSTPTKIHILECDTSSAASIAAFGQSVTTTLGSAHAQLDYLLNNAGINAVPSQTALNLDAADLQQHIAVNVLGPAKTVEAVLRHLQRGSVVMNMSSGLGSCAKGVVKCASYAISKAALDMLSVHQAGLLAERGVSCVVMDPGWVKTRMGGEGAVLEPAESIRGMLEVLHGLRGKDLKGKAVFLQFDGEEVPW